MINILCKECGSELTACKEKGFEELYECPDKINCGLVFKLKSHSIVRDYLKYNIIAQFPDPTDDKKDEAIVCGLCNEFIDYRKVISCKSNENDFTIRIVSRHDCKSSGI